MKMLGKGVWKRGKRKRKDGGVWERKKERGRKEEEKEGIDEKKKRKDEGVCGKEGRGRMKVCVEKKEREG